MSVSTPPTTSSASGSTYFLSTWLFLRLLGVVYGVAFVSLWVQVEGLLGVHGILPAGDSLTPLEGYYGGLKYWHVPTVFWVRADDAALNVACGAGAVLAGLLAIGVAEIVVLPCLWVLYLSLFNVGQIFLGYQWDILLLEVGFLAIFLAPLAPLPRIVRGSHPSPMVLLLFKLLFFKLMFLSGLVKLQSQDPTWRDLSAMTYHFLTQPLPTRLAYYVHQLPAWTLMLCTMMTFVVELLVPFGIFTPRRLRHAAAAALVGMQVLIAATGSYGFFNLLTVALCALLLDDALLLRWCPASVRQRLDDAVAAHSPGLLRRPRQLALGGGLAILIAVLNEGGFRTFNRYGLFAVMTTSRPEIIVSGSLDGETWREYRFRWKPGPLGRPPVLAAPHQPRLDWQMWFAALSSPDSPRVVWLQRFAVHLLRGTPEVVALLEENPFPDRPPRYVRADLYDYRFTTFAQRGETGDWWTREFLGVYLPPVRVAPD